MHTQDYEKIWNNYSDRFGKTPGTAHAEHLGDEWANHQLSLARFEQFIKPHLAQGGDVGELGVGGGKYSVLAAPFVSRLYGIDISQNMLERTADRLKETNCDFIPIKCADSQIPLPDGSLDFFFSLDSMVHIFPYDLFSYVAEVGRILKAQAIAVIEFADWDQPGAINKFVLDHEHFVRQRQLSPGAFGFISRCAMEQFGARAGLKTLQFQEVSKRSSVVTLQKS